MSDLLRALAPASLLLPDALLAALRASYAGPGRAYHSLSHIEDVARHFDRVRREVGWGAPREVYLAVLYHDAVYVPGAPSNESDSAELARAAIATWLPDIGIDGERVSELILATKGHGHARPAPTQDTALFLDCDMAVLGAEPEVYDAYARGVAQEFSWLPREHYLEGRARFLQSLLASESIFLSTAFRERLEGQARANIARELAQR